MKHTEASLSPNLIDLMLTSCLDTYISRYGDICAHNDNEMLCGFVFVVNFVDKPEPSLAGHRAIHVCELVLASYHPSILKNINFVLHGYLLSSGILNV